MTAPAFLLATSAVAALLAFVLLFVAEGWAQRIATVALWLAIATVPASLAWDIAHPPVRGPDAPAKATRLAAAISDLMNYGVAIMPVAGIAMIVLRRAKIASSKRGAQS
jgi:hypothetical protein